MSYINSVSCIAERVRGADVNVIAAGMGMDERIGPILIKSSFLLRIILNGIRTVDCSMFPVDLDRRFT